jgi:hypothetical protein
MALARLEDIPEETWGNAILYRLALELGYEPNEELTIVGDPDTILEEALENLYIHREGCY